MRVAAEGGAAAGAAPVRAYTDEDYKRDLAKDQGLMLPAAACHCAVLCCFG